MHASIVTQVKHFLRMPAVSWGCVAVVFMAFIISLGTRGKCRSVATDGAAPPFPVCVTDPARRVLLISVDGFRADYLSHILAASAVDATAFPGFLWLLSHGSRAQAMLAQFPTVTFPNHWVIATGLYPAWNGVIGNSFLLRNASGSFQFNMQSKDPNMWLGEPIWLTAQKVRYCGRHGDARRLVLTLSPGGRVREDILLARLRDCLGEGRLTLGPRTDGSRLRWPQDADRAGGCCAGLLQQRQAAHVPDSLL